MSLDLKRPDLVQEGALAGGRWVDVESGGLAATNPATGRIPGPVSDLFAVEETSGPIAPLFRFGTEAEEIAATNDIEFDLASDFYSRDIVQVWRVSVGIEYGLVGVNTGLVCTTRVPLEEVKPTGLSRKGGRQGLGDFMEVKYTSMIGIKEASA